MCNTGVGVKTQEYYENFVKSDNIMTVLNISGEHTFVRYPWPFYFLSEISVSCDINLGEKKTKNPGAYNYVVAV